MQRLVLASNNPGKLREFGTLLAPLGFDVVPQGELGIPEAEEPFVTFVENALAKARHASRLSGLPALADDSGISARALGGAPGVYSARWAGPNKDFGVAMKRVWELLSASGADRSARFVCALALATPGGGVEVFEGEARGRIVWPPRGDKGVRYDPIFEPEGHARTFGDVSHDEKLPLTHRARAFEKLVASLK